MRLALATLCAALPALSAQADCRIALALAIDVSRSIDEKDYEIQRTGLVAALNDPGIRQAILGPDDRVALAVYEWSGVGFQIVVADWQVIETAADIDALANLIASYQRPYFPMNTALGEALVFGLDLLSRAPDCARQVLDVSGDGQNNTGIRVSTAYSRHDWGTVIVNGLAIAEHESEVYNFYRDQVIRGPGAFVELARRQADFPEAIRRKLLRELTEPVLGLDPDPAWRDIGAATISEGEGRVTHRYDRQRRPGPVSALRDPQG